MSETIQEKWREIVIALVLAWQSWLSIEVISMNKDIALIKNNQAESIPSGTERALQEIRGRLNDDSKERSALLLLVHDNVSAVSSLKEAIGRLSK